jgi:hypothetical protein
MASSNVTTVAWEAAHRPAAIRETARRFTTAIRF